MSKVNYFEKYGQALLSAGFNCVPIISGLSPHKQAGKAPAVKGWQRIEFDQRLLTEWVDKYSRSGIGIQTRFTPAVDIDCPDEEAADYMRDLVEARLGKTMARVGRAPKLLLLYRTEDPFTKVKSHTWLDDFGGRQAVEILGSGQQFVAFGIHPVTKKPYKWITESKPTDCDIDLDLPLIDLKAAQDIAKAFDLYAKGRGWTLDKDTPAINGGDDVDVWGNVGLDDDQSFDAEDLLIKWEGTVEELAEIFEDLPAEDSYDKWYPVLAALKDAEREADEFKEIARDWSAKSDNYDEVAFEEKWEKGAFGRVIGRVANIHSIVKRVARIRRENEVIDNIIPDFNNCLTMKDWMVYAERMSETEVFGPVRELAVDVATEAYKRINSVKKVPKSAIDYLAFDFSKFDAPGWLAPWVFDSKNGVFVNRRSFQPVGPYAFNMLNARPLKDMGVKKKPDAFAAEDFPIPMVDGLMYYPAMHGLMPENRHEPVVGQDGPEFFTYQGQVYLNTFDPSTIPVMPESFSKAQLAAIEVVMGFFAVQFPNEKERRYVMDFLAWVIQHPTRRVNYALLIIGCEGSGKSIIKKFMTYLLGGTQNVGTVSNVVLQKSFTSWMHGHILKVIEEISIPGHRYDIVNLLKEPITNESMQTEGKHRDASEGVNTASYMMFSNDRGAIPVGEESRRFLTVMSYFEYKPQVEEFMRENPRFFKRFELAFMRHAGAIRKFFCEWEFSADFNHEGHAPRDTEARMVMQQMNTDPLVEAIETAIASGDVSGVTKEVIHASGLTNLLYSVGMKSSASVARRLAELGFETPGTTRARVRLNGVLGTVYVNREYREKFGGDKLDLVLVACHLQKHAEFAKDSEFDDI
jgi:hypothetical protein